MKKFITVALALGLCVAVAMPAAAAVSVSGNVGYEIRYEKRGEDHSTSTASNGNEFKTFEIYPVVEKANIRFDWEAGPATPYIDLQMRKYKTKFGDWTNKADATEDQVYVAFGVDYTNPSGAWGGWWEAKREWNDDRNIAISTNLVTGASNQDMAYDAEIWWQVNPMFKLSFGQFSVTGGGKGVEKTGLYATTDNEYVARAELALPIGKLTMDVIDPKEAGATIGWLTAQEDQTSAGFAAKLDAKLGPISVSPSFYTVNYEYDSNVTNPNTGVDSSFTSWAIAIPIKGQLGPVGLSASYAWGENTFHGYQKFYQTHGLQKVVKALNSAGNMQFYDTDFTGWTINADINAGIGKLSVGYGYEEADAYATATTRAVTEADTFRIAYAIPVGKGFTITPKYMKFDSGETKVGGIVNPATDDATTKIYLVNFNVRF